MKRGFDNVERFPGFVQDIYDGFFMYPTRLEGYWHTLTGSELKVLTFIMRQTIGWNKVYDSIAWKQFARGIGGKSKNMGTGLSVAQIRTAAKELENKGFIWIVRRKVAPCIFRLRLEGEKINPLTKKPRWDKRTDEQIAAAISKRVEVFTYENENKRIRNTDRLDEYRSDGLGRPSDPEPQDDWVISEAP